MLDEHVGNQKLSWFLTAVLGGLAVANGLLGSYRWFVFTGLALVVLVLPAVLSRDPGVVVPWELLVLLLIPVVDGTVPGESAVTTVATYVAVAAVALVIVVELDQFTPVRMTHAFAVVLVVLTTLAVAAAWNVGLWLADVTLGTDYVVGSRAQDAANESLMIEFTLAAVAGVLAGVGFDRYFLQTTGTPNGEPSQDDGPTDGATDDASHGSSETSVGPAFVRGRFDVSDRTVIRLSRVMQGVLVVLLGYGLVARDVTTVANAGIALGLTVLPWFLRQNGRVVLEPELTFWLTSAVFLHVLGSAGLYDLVTVFDNLTHALSASVVAAAGYTGVRAIDLYTDEVSLPPVALFAFILVFVLAFGVVWELVEFAIDTTADLLGIEAVLAQHGIDDTIVDLVFDAVGAAVVSLGGWVYLTDLSQQLAGELGDRGAGGDES